MIEAGADAAAHRVRQPALGANVAEQARREAAAEDFIENLDSVSSQDCATFGAEGNHANVALVHVLFGDQVVAGLGGLELDLFFLQQPGPLGQEPNAAFSLASIAAESKSPLTPRMMLLGWT